MFFHIFKNRLKILLRKKSVIFWTMIFPIILATLFHLAFSDIQNDEKLKVIDVAVIKNEQYDNNQTLKTVLESVSKDDDNKFRNILCKIRAASAVEDNGFVFLQPLQTRC